MDDRRGATMSEASKTQRAAWAREAVARYRDISGSDGNDDDREAQIADVIADLHHLADEESIDWTEVERRAAMYHSTDGTDL